MNEQVIEGLRDVLQAHAVGLGSEGCEALNAAIRALEESPEYRMMDKEGKLGKGPTPYDALVQYLMAAWPEALETLDQVGARLERYGPYPPVRVGVVWTTDGGIPDEISVYADLDRAEAAYHQWWAKDGVAPEDIEEEKYNRIDGEEAHFYVVDVVWDGNKKVSEPSQDDISGLPESDLVTILEVARNALDGYFEAMAGDLDLSDEEMWHIQALVEKLLAGNRIRNETIHIVQDKDTQVTEISPCRVREVARARGIVLSPEQEQEVAQRVAAHLSENVQTEIDYALDSFEGGRDSA
jgi:hypothetical protein